MTFPVKQTVLWAGLTYMV